MCMSLAQGGAGFPFFSNVIFEYLCGKENIKVDTDSVPNEQGRQLLLKVWPM